MSAIQRAYKTELDLNNQQITACKKHAGAARWAYNWGLARKQEAYRATGKSPSAIDLHRELNALKQTDVPWMYEVSKCAPQEALRNLDTAFAHFFRRAKLKQQGKLRGKLGLSQAQDAGSAGWAASASPAPSSVFPEPIQLPRLGRLRLKERGYLPSRCQDPLGHRHRAGRTLVRLGAGGAGAGRAGEHGASGGGGPGRQDAGHALGRRRRSPTRAT